MAFLFLILNPQIAKFYNNFMIYEHFTVIHGWSRISLIKAFYYRLSRLLPHGWLLNLAENIQKT